MALGNKLIERHIRLVEGASDAVIDLVYVAQRSFWSSFKSLFFNKVKTEKGRFINTQQNKRLIPKIDAAYKSVMDKEGMAIASKIKTTIDELLEINLQQYKGFGTVKRIEAVSDVARAQLYELLGFTKEGGLQQGGYLDVMLRDRTIPEKIKKQALQGITTKADADVFLSSLERSITGDRDKGVGGMLKDFQKDAGNDVIATADRLIGEQYRENLGLNFAIYEGSLVKTSRIFCIEHAGKVYHRSEIAKFDPPEAKPPGYNPFTDLGGYNCRHFLNWISDQLAVRLRPDAKQFLEKEDA